MHLAPWAGDPDTLFERLQERIENVPFPVLEVTRQVSVPPAPVVKESAPAHRYYPRQ